MGKRFENIDWITFILLVLLGLFGIFLLLTIDFTLFYQQFSFFIVSLLVLIFFSNIDKVFLKWFSPIAYILSIILLASSYLGTSVRGANRWLTIAGINLQPSELVKPLLLLSFSWLIARYPPRNPKYLPIHIISFVIPFLIVFRQPDLGTSLIYFCLWMGMLIAGGLSLKLLFTFVLGSLLILPWGWGILKEYQKNRIITFFNPNFDPRGAGYNSIQAVIAIGSGQLFGRGLGRGTQSHLRFLPEYHTDFIFASLVEELGFFGGFTLILLYFLLLWKLIISSRKYINNVYLFVFTFGLFSLVLSQIFINIGMNLGILPITGITLPFISYGGSSLLSLSMSFGLFWSLKKRNTRKNTDIEIA